MQTDTHGDSGGEELLTAAAVSSLANISRSTIGRAVKAGKLTPLRTPGGHLRFRRGDVEALLTADPAKASA